MFTQHEGSWGSVEARRAISTAQARAHAGASARAAEAGVGFRVRRGACPAPRCARTRQTRARLLQAARRCVRDVPFQSQPAHHPTCARTSTHVHVRVPGTSSPDSRDVTCLARMRPPRATEFTTQQGTWVGWWGEKKIHHTLACTRDVRDEQPQEARLERPSSPPRSRPALPEQASRASPAVSHLEEGGRERSAVNCNRPHGSNDQSPSRDVLWRFMTHRARGGARPCVPKHSLDLLQAFGSLLVGLGGWLAGWLSWTPVARLALVSLASLAR